MSCKFVYNRSFVCVVIYRRNFEETFSLSFRATGNLWRVEYYTHIISRCRRRRRGFHHPLRSFPAFLLFLLFAQLLCVYVLGLWGHRLALFMRCHTRLNRKDLRCRVFRRPWRSFTGSIRQLTRRRRTCLLNWKPNSSVLKAIFQNNIGAEGERKKLAGSEQFSSTLCEEEAKVIKGFGAYRVAVCWCWIVHLSFSYFAKMFE